HLRGQSYLTAHCGQDAALEFSKNCRPPWLTSIIGALSQVGLDRAFILQRDFPRVRATYENFFSPGRMRTGTYLYWPLPNSNTQSFADYSNPLRTVRWFGLFSWASIETLRSAMRASVPTSSSIHFPIGASLRSA